MKKSVVLTAEPETQQQFFSPGEVKDIVKEALEEHYQTKDTDASEPSKPDTYGVEIAWYKEDHNENNQNLALQSCEELEALDINRVVNSALDFFEMSSACESMTIKFVKSKNK